MNAEQTDLTLGPLLKGRIVMVRVTWGFIRPEPNGLDSRDCFFHVTHLMVPDVQLDHRLLDREVTYRVETYGETGRRRAREVRLVGDTSPGETSPVPARDSWREMY